MIQILIMLIPILSGLTALISSIISMAVNKKNNPAMANQGASMGVMMLMAPIMSLWIAFAVPAGVGFYWTISNIFLIFQTIIIGKIYTPEKLKELAEKEIEKNKSKRAIYTTATVVDKKTGEEKTQCFYQKIKHFKKTKGSTGVSSLFIRGGTVKRSYFIWI